MDDTVLQTHRVDPRLTQVILLANGTVYFYFLSNTTNM